MPSSFNPTAIFENFAPMARNATFWLPEQGSVAAASVDRVFYFIYWISAFFLVFLFAITIYMAWRFRQKRKGEKTEESPAHHTGLELLWSGIPLLIVIATFYMGFKGYLDLVTPPENSYDVTVTGQKWSWNFTYPNGYVDSKLYVPKDIPVKLTIASEDVIHSFFVPAFRIKMDAVPGRYNKIWFEANKTGRFDAVCAEYCGTDHSAMITEVVVLEKPEFDRWLEDASNFIDKMPPAEAGKRLFEVRGCLQCHTVDGKAKIGPTLKGVFGHEVALKTGKKVAADENYIRKSIFDPQADVVAGFDPVMPTYQGRLKDREITVLIEYLKSLSD